MEDRTTGNVKIAPPDAAASIPDGVTVPEQASADAATDDAQEKVPRKCAVCGRLLPAGRDSDTCRACEDYDLFLQIRRYISDHQAMNYHEIARDFRIPEKLALKFVRRRIEEQKDTEEGTLEELFSSQYCMICGEPAVYGRLCPGCSRERYRTNHPKTSEAPGDLTAGMRHIGTERREG